MNRRLLELDARALHNTGLHDVAERIEAALVTYDEIERELRRELWMHHGHPFSALYGDDGEMQCSACPCDFKRQPLPEVRQAVLRARMAVQ